MANQRRRTSQSTRRKRIWAREQFSLASSATGTAVDLLTDFRAELGVTANPPGLTIAGVLLDFVVTRVSAEAAPGDHSAIGLLVSNEETPADVQGPLTEPHVDWFWYQVLTAPGDALGASIGTFQAAGGAVRAKSGRKMEEIGMRLYLVHEQSGLTDFQIDGVASTLVLLP